MWPTSPAFQQALLASSRRWATKLEVLYANEVVTSLDVMIQGYIGMDEVAVRRELHTTIVDADGVFTPSQASDLLTPKGTEIRAYRGLLVGSDYEWVPMGVFGVVEPEVRSHSEGTVVELKGFDRVDRLRALHFENPWVVAQGTPVHQAMSDIITSRLFNVPLRVTPSAFVTPALIYDRLTSPWDALTDLGAAVGYTVYFDPLGTCVVEPLTSPLTGVTYGVGSNGVLMTSSRKFLPTDGLYSGVVARGEHPDGTPIKVEKWDVDPASPTYSLGPFGRRPYGLFNPGITSEAQAQPLVDAAFARVTKMHQECEIQTRGTPAHDIGDIITITDPRSRTNGNYRLISATIPLKNEQGAHVRLRCQEA